MADPAEPHLDRVASYPQPPRRALRIFAFDPMVSRVSGGETVTLTVPYEPLLPGPRGELLSVIDYDGAARCYYEPVDLDDPRVLIQDGLAPTERDPRFHQQMVYAVTSALLENFERGLGRRFRWRGDSRLRVFPHAFRGANARFDPDLDGLILYGYFRADPTNPGRNLPGQPVFTCLSHDIIVHESAHALVHRQRRYFREPTNVDVYAFHEGFADLVALFQHFTLPDVVDRYIQQTQADLSAPTPLVDLAQQFGESTGTGRALRSALGEAPDPAVLERTVEPHQRGAILVAAVFDAFVASYRQATSDLIRIATSGTGVLPSGALSPDLVARISTEARTTAQRLLTMCIRSFQYLPPVDVTFSDFLRSIVTADRDLFPGDDAGLRANLVEGFRRRGIYPDDVGSLGEDALSWPEVDTGLPDLPDALVQGLMLQTALSYMPNRGLEKQSGPEENRAHYNALLGYANANRLRLGLHPDVEVQVDGFHAAFRVGAGGAPRMDIICRFLQSVPLNEVDPEQYGGLPLRGGTTLVADATGRVRHVVSRPCPLGSATGPLHDAGMLRLAAIADFVSDFGGSEATGPWRAGTTAISDILDFSRIDA